MMTTSHAGHLLEPNGTLPAGVHCDLIGEAPGALQAVALHRSGRVIRRGRRGNTGDVWVYLDIGVLGPARVRRLIFERRAGCVRKPELMPPAPAGRPAMG